MSLHQEDFITVDCAMQFFARMVKLFIAYGIREHFPSTNYIINQDPQLWRDAASIGQMDITLPTIILRTRIQNRWKEWKQTMLHFKSNFQKPDFLRLHELPYGAWTANFMVAQLHNLLIKWTAAP